MNGVIEVYLRQLERRLWLNKSAMLSVIAEFRVHLIQLERERGKFSTLADVEAAFGTVDVLARRVNAAAPIWKKLPLFRGLGWQVIRTYGLMVLTIIPFAVVFSALTEGREISGLAAYATMVVPLSVLFIALYYAQASTAIQLIRRGMPSSTVMTFALVPAVVMAMASALELATKAQSWPELIMQLAASSSIFLGIAFMTARVLSMRSQGDVSTRARIVLGIGPAVMHFAFALIADACAGTFFTVGADAVISLTLLVVGLTASFRFARCDLSPYGHFPNTDRRKIATVG
jgi:hypothetical protein